MQKMPWTTNSLLPRALFKHTQDAGQINTNLKMK